MRMGTWRRSVALGVVATTALGTMWAGAGTAAAADSSKDGLAHLITEFDTLTIAGNLRLDPTTGATSLAGGRQGDHRPGRPGKQARRLA